MSSGRNKSKGNFKNWLILAIFVFFIGLIFMYFNRLGASRFSTAPLEIIKQAEQLEVTILQNEPHKSTGIMTTQVEVRENGELYDLHGKGIFINVGLADTNLTDANFFHSQETLDEVKPGVYQFTHDFQGGKTYDFWLEVNDTVSHDHHGVEFAKYVARWEKDIPLNENFAVQEISDLTTAFFAEENVVVDMSHAPLKAGQPVEFTFTMRKQDGTVVPFVPEFDHFAFFIKPDLDWARIRHANFDKTEYEEMTLHSLVFPEPGEYLMWFHLYEDEGSVPEKKIYKARTTYATAFRITVE